MDDMTIIDNNYFGSTITTDDDDNSDFNKVGAEQFNNLILMELIVAYGLIQKENLLERVASSYNYTGCVNNNTFRTIM